MKLTSCLDLSALLVSYGIHVLIDDTIRYDATKVEKNTDKQMCTDFKNYSVQCYEFTTKLSNSNDAGCTAVAYIDIDQMRCVFVNIMYTHINLKFCSKC